VLSLQYSPDSEILGLTGYNGSVRLVRLLDLDSAQGFGGSARSEQSISFLPDARIVVITSDGTVVIVDLTTGDSTTLEGLQGQPIGVVTSRSGKYVAAGSNSGNVVIWNAADGKQLTTIKTSFTAAQLLEFSYTGELLAVTGASETPQVDVWNVADGSRVSTLTGPAERITGIAFQPGGVVLAATSVDQSLRLWDAQSGTPIRTINAADEQGWYLTTAFSADGSVLAAGALNGDLQLWNVRDGSEITRFDLSGSVFSIAFSPDGKQLAASVIDGTVRILKP
jgi:WD40 repeat protein